MTSELFIQGNLLLAGFLFMVGMIGFFVKSNAITLFMCVELMLNAANLAIVTFGAMLGSTVGTILCLFVIVLAAAEAVVGLAIFVALSRHRHSIDVGSFDTMKG